MNIMAGGQLEEEAWSKLGEPISHQIVFLLTAPNEQNEKKSVKNDSSVDSSTVSGRHFSGKK